MNYAPTYKVLHPVDRVSTMSSSNWKLKKGAGSIFDGAGGEGLTLEWENSK